jgi:putative transposase
LPGRGWSRHRGDQGQAGASSCEPRRQASWRATSSPSRASSCAATTCCSSSRTQAVASGSPAAPPTPPAWVAQQARNLGFDFAEKDVRFLIRDRDSKYSGRFDELFRSEEIRIVKTPVRAPKANAIAERFVRTVRAECLNWLLILNRRHLERVLGVYVDHYNTQRPHRALQLQPPEPEQQHARSTAAEIRRRDRLGGLIHEYYRAAA